MAVCEPLPGVASPVAEHRLQGTLPSAAAARGLSSGGSWAMEHRLSRCGARVMEHRLSSGGSRAMKHRLSRCGARVQSLCGVWETLQTRA